MTTLGTHPGACALHAPPMWHARVKPRGLMVDRYASLECSEMRLRRLQSVDRGKDAGGFRWASGQDDLERPPIRRWPGIGQATRCCVRCEALVGSAGLSGPI